MKTNTLFVKTLCAGFVCAAMTLTSAFAQVKIGTNPTTINAANNLEVEASTAGRKTSIDKTTGQVTIADGTQGDGKILTSDANGGASWQPAHATTIITGLNNVVPPVSFSSPTSEYIADCPITLNKGIYELIYYVQYNFADGGATGASPNQWPAYIYFNFVATSGSAFFPSYTWGGVPNAGPHVIPIISYYQVAAKVSQLVVVNSDNTVIKPRYSFLHRAGTLGGVGAIVAMKL